MITFLMDYNSTLCFSNVTNFTYHDYDTIPSFVEGQT